MLKNLFKVMLRNLKKYKAFSLINILGLSIGMACCLLILLYVSDELSFDRHNVLGSRVYRLNSHSTIGGTTLALDAIQNLKRRIEAGNLKHGKGERLSADVKTAYVDKIVGDVNLARPLKIVMDCGNGVAGAVAPELFRRLGCEIIPLFCEVDGNFPNHHPDPSKPENLADVIKALQDTDAEIGIAFDGDGDRLGVVTKDGEIIYPDRQLMLFAADVLTRQPGAQMVIQDAPQ